MSSTGGWRICILFLHCSFMFDNAGMEAVAKSSLVDDGWFLFWLVALALVAIVFLILILVLFIIITVIELVDALEESFLTLIISWSSTRAC